MRELSMVEVEQVSGGFMKIEKGLPYFATAVSLGRAVYGTAWATMAVGGAVAASPIVLGAMVGLTLAGGIATVLN